MNSKKPSHMPGEALLASTSQGYLLKASTSPRLEELEKCGYAHASRRTLIA